MYRSSLKQPCAVFHPRTFPRRLLIRYIRFQRAKNEGFRLLFPKGINAIPDRKSSEQPEAKRPERTEGRTDSRNGVLMRELKDSLRLQKYH